MQLSFFKQINIANIPIYISTLKYFRIHISGTRNEKAKIQSKQSKTAWLILETANMQFYTALMHFFPRWGVDGNEKWKSFSFSYLDLGQTRYKQWQSHLYMKPLDKTFVKRKKRATAIKAVEIACSTWEYSTSLDKLSYQSIS